MPAQDRSLLCRYQYDPLDRLASLAPPEACELQRFYLKNRLVTEIHGTIQQSIVQYEDQLLAQQQRQDEVLSTTLLATDQQRSVLHTLAPDGPRPGMAYSVYGHQPADNGLLSLLGFNGERLDRITGHYLLGNGYRVFNPVLMRFNSPDNRSPFAEGGINTYAYCMGDPVNQTDPSGHAPAWLKSILRFAGIMRPHTATSRLLPPPMMVQSQLPPTASPAGAITSTSPPPYSPPRGRRTTPTAAHSSHDTPSNAQLEQEIARQEASASIQRSRLDDIANGLRPDLDDRYAELHQTWSDTREYITLLNSQIRPPNYHQIAHPKPKTNPSSYDENYLPDYQEAIRKNS
ncbi:RHS repeat-associated core domain-containing protein [Pseudomonas batumici]|uniref:RHS repeat-associated core domain-containing protein n=1 Tax=Pseudomonas batumici TaxID=226910 RepID=UPI000A0244B1|nr:RHS repeat-associated core domain-containing protein [Pseudomonas batumici]